MTKERKALKLALEKFEFMNHVDSIFEGEFDFQINAIKEALAQPEQEPVAWSHAGAMPPEQEVMKEAAYQLAPWLSAALDDPKVCKEYKDVINAWFDAAMPAPQRTWVGLTDGEVDKMILLMGFPPDWITENAIVKNIVRNLEASIKEKNT